MPVVGYISRIRGLDAAVKEQLSNPVLQVVDTRAVYDRCPDDLHVRIASAKILCIKLRFEIEFIHNDDHLLIGYGIKNLDILICERFVVVYDIENQFGLDECLTAALHTDFLDDVVGIPDSRRIDELEWNAVDIYVLLQNITRCSVCVGDDRLVVLDEIIEE